MGGITLRHEDIYGLYLNNWLYDNALFVSEEAFGNRGTRRRLDAKLETLTKNTPDDNACQMYLAGYNHVFCNFLFDAGRQTEARMAIASIVASEPAYMLLERLLEPLGTSVLAECEREGSFYSPTEIDNIVIERFAPGAEEFLDAYLGARCMGIVHLPSKKVSLAFDGSSIISMDSQQFSGRVYLPKLDFTLESFTYKDENDLGSRINRVRERLGGPMVVIDTKNPKLFNYFAWRYVMQQAGAAIDESSMFKPFSYKPITLIPGSTSPRSRQAHP